MASVSPFSFGAVKMSMHRVILTIIVSMFSLGSGLDVQAKSLSFLERQPYVQYVSPSERSIMCSSATKAAVLKVSYKDEKGVALGTVPMEATGAGTLYRGLLKNLKPSQRYSYRVEGASQKTDWATFITPPPTGSTKPFRFGFYGDTRTQYKVHKEVADSIAQEKDLAFLLHAGDIVNNGSKTKSWEKEFFGPGANAFAQTLLLPCFGNHERHHQNFYDNFELPANPGKEAYYSIDFGNVHVVVIDQYQPYGPKSDQGKWLQKDLLSTKESMWKVVLFHEPPFSNSHKRGVNTLVIDYLVGTLEKGGVDLVINGHDHFYLRTKPLGKKGVAFPTYVVAGGGGAPVYAPKPTEFVEKMTPEYHYATVEVTQDTLSITVKKPDNTVIDSFVITRDENPAGALDRDDVIRAPLYQYNLNKKILKALKVGVLKKGADGTNTTVKLAWHNNILEDSNITFAWDLRNTKWKVTPEKQQVQTPADTDASISWSFHLNPEDAFYPVPVLRVSGSNLKPSLYFLTAIGGKRPEAEIASSTIAPTVNGLKDEAFWKTNPDFANLLLETGEGYPKNSTKVSAIATEQGLLLFITNAEDDFTSMRAELNERNHAWLWRDDCNEIFIEPVKGSGIYYQFIINSNNALFDAKGRNSKWMSSMKTAVKKEAKTWNIEALIPWSDLEFKEKPKAGHKMGFNITRTENHATIHGMSKYLQEWQQWSLTFGSNHQPKKFGTLILK